MIFTEDELTVIIESLREYRLRADVNRKVICEMLVYRFGQTLVSMATEKIKAMNYVE